jgi:hypothetical protein
VAVGNPDPPLDGQSTATPSPTPTHSHPNTDAVSHGDEDPHILPDGHPNPNPYAGGDGDALAFPDGHLDAGRDVRPRRR